MKTILAAIIIGASIILSALLHGGIYTATNSEIPSAINKFTGTVSVKTR